MRRMHKVPLSDQAVAVLHEAAALRRAECELVFPSTRDGWLSDMTLTKALRDLGEQVTQHGFRSSFRDWAAEATSVPDAVADSCLAHALEDKVLAAYRRTDFFDARRSLMAAWGRFCVAGERGQIFRLEARRS